MKLPFEYRAKGIDQDRLSGSHQNGRFPGGTPFLVGIKGSPKKKATFFGGVPTKDIPASASPAPPKNGSKIT